jgi:hypothetical protein
MENKEIAEKITGIILYNMHVSDNQQLALCEANAIICKVESGELVEVVRCKDCQDYIPEGSLCQSDICCYGTSNVIDKNHYCSFSEKALKGAE